MRSSATGRTAACHVGTRRRHAFLLTIIQCMLSTSTLVTKFFIILRDTDESEMSVTFEILFAISFTTINQQQTRLVSTK